MALSATADVYSDEDCATKILPGIIPSLIDKEKYDGLGIIIFASLTNLLTRMVRDQANKTLEIFLQRVRKYAQTLPETVQPPANSTSANPPRMSTPGTESSWTGWAISSFTNKLTSVNGQMSSSGDGSSVPEERPSSVPAPSTGPFRPPTSATAKQIQSAPGIPSLKPAKQNPFAASTSPLQASESADDIDAWDDEDNPWGGDQDDDPFSPKTSKSNTSAAEDMFDDKGEPDFAGWLSAQAQGKSAVKKPLPKGLAKTATTNLAKRPSLGKASSTGNTTTKKTVTIAQPAVKKKETPKATDEEEEGWGEEWE
jgi:SCY1-like protein 1